MSGMLDENNGLYALPQFTTRSSGTRILLYGATNQSSVDYALGIDGSTLWSSVPQTNSTHSFKWYGGQSSVASLHGDGVFDVNQVQCTQVNTSKINAGSTFIHNMISVERQKLLLLSIIHISIRTCL